MKQFLWLIFNISLLSPLASQQLEQYTQFSINPFLINPAVAGTEDFLPIKVGYRNQWFGFEDAPRTAYFSAHTTLNNKQLIDAKRKRKQTSRIALGVNIISDRTGPIEQNSARITFAYNLALNSQGLRLSLGLSPGFKQFSYDPAGYTDNLLDPDDPTITEVENSYLLQLAAGAWLYNDDFFLGASSFQLINAVVAGSLDQASALSETAFARHYYFMGGVNISLGDRVSLVPSLLLKTLTESAISYDINSKFIFDNQFWLGANYRKEDAVGFFTGVLIDDRIELHLSYDLVTSAIRNAAAGSIEVHLGYRIFNQNSVVCPARFW